MTLFFSKLATGLHSDLLTHLAPRCKTHSQQAQAKYGNRARFGNVGAWAAGVGCQCKIKGFLSTGCVSRGCQQPDTVGCRAKRRCRQEDVCRVEAKDKTRTACAGVCVGKGNRRETA